MLARYSDGTARDVTPLALFESNDTALAEVTEDGLVSAHDLPGNVSIMVRYQGRVAVFGASIPLGASITELPASKNFIDDLVFTNLKELGIPPSPSCDDSTFMRRAALDIAGRLPTTEETAEFLASDDPNRRERYVDELLKSPQYADYFANKWTALPCVSANT